MRENGAARVGVSGGAGRTAALARAALVALLLVLILAAAVPREARAHEWAMADSDGYVPLYSVCDYGDWLGSYSWHFDGYSTYGYVTINECALERYGAGPYDRQRVLDHEYGHAAGLPHSLDPFDVMYAYTLITGT